MVENQVLDLAQSVVNQLNSNITYYFKEMDLMSNVIYYQLENNDILLLDEIGRFLHELKSNRPFIAEIHILTDKQTISTAGIIEREGLEKSEWYVEALRQIDKKSWIRPHTTEYIRDSTGERAISLMYPYLHRGKLRVILIEMKLNEFDQLFKTDLKNLGALIIIDKYGKVIYSTDHTIIDGNSNQYVSYSTLFGPLNEKYRLVYDVNFLSGWKVAALISEDQINKSFASIKKIVAIVLILFFACSIFLASLLSHQFIKPLRRLQRDIRSVEKGDFKIRTKIESLDEIGDLSKSFNRMVSEIETLIKEISINEKKKKQIEMQSLQYQINPHFLYNTLNSIQWIAKIHKVPDISEMLTNLIKLLRTSLDSANHLHTLEQELEVLNYYLKIQKHRYSNRFQINYFIEKRFLSVSIPRFTLQPLVENIFFHAFTDGQGTIQIKTIADGDTLIIAVEDDGRGMPQETVEKLLKKQHTKEEKTSSGIGLHNVDEKIKLYFGSSYGIDIKSELGKGTTIFVRLPIHFEKGVKE